MLGRWPNDRALEEANAFAAMLREHYDDDLSIEENLNFFGGV
jgi:hypothetical protein